MTTQVNDINAVESKFYKSLGDGKKAGQHLQSLILSVVDSRDTTVLCRAIKRAEEKGDKHAASIVKFVTGKVWSGAKATKDKNGNMSIKIKGIEADPDMLAALKQAVEKDLSIRHSTFRSMFNPAPVKKEFDVAAWAERMKKQHEDDLEAMIAALQALRG